MNGALLSGSSVLTLGPLGRRLLLEPAPRTLCFLAPEWQRWEGMQSGIKSGDFEHPADPPSQGRPATHRLRPGVLAGGGLAH